MNYHHMNMYKIERFPQKYNLFLENEITFPSMMEEIQNEEFADNNENVTDKGLGYTKK